MRLSVSVFSLLLAGCAVLTTSPPADLLLTNGRIITVDTQRPSAEAMAIRNGRFVYVGSNGEAEQLIGRRTTVIDLGGRLVIPGIVDAHTHPGQIDMIRHDVPIVASGREEFLAALADHVSESTGDGWLRICCWPVMGFVTEGRGPDRADLDRLFPNRPVWVSSDAGHSFWLNSKALEQLGIDEGTPDPRFPVAMFKRDDTGRLTGWVKEGAGWQRMDDVFKIDRERHESGMRAMLKRLSGLGVVALYDAGTKEWSDRVYAFLAALERAGELPLRYEGTYRISTPDKLDTAVNEMKRYRVDYGGERLRFNTIKLFMDGVHENRSGALKEPYVDDSQHVSDTTLSVAELRDFLLRLHEERFDLHVHTIGDLAVQRVLDAVEQAKASVADFYPRVSMGHLQNTDPADWPRFAELGVSANFTPWWLGPDQPDPVAAGLGPDRANDTYRAKALFDAGANVTFSSDDWTLDVLSPYLGMQVAHTRQYPREWLSNGEDPERIREPASEKIPLDLLLRGYTLNGAYQLRMEDEIGSIEAGKSADFVVLDDDLFRMNPYELHKVKPHSVFLAGKQQPPP